jgi:hypothetical protein
MTGESDAVEAYLHATGEIIPSYGKEEGWKRYVSSLDSLLVARRPASEELKELHRLMTGHLPVPSAAQLPHKTQLYILDREDGEEKQKILNERAKPQFEALEGTDDFSEIHDYLMEITNIYEELCKEDTEIDYKPELIGSLRAYGTRRIKGGEPGTVFASHMCTFDGAGAFGAALAGLPPPAYYGLSTGLDMVYTALCDKYDQMAQEAGTDFQKALLAESFLQVWGTRVLHPFWDANGRAFAAHLGLTLERHGIEVREWGVARCITADLTALNDDFLHHVLGNAGLGLINMLDHYKIQLDHALRQEYMGRLKKELEQGIETGLDPQSSYWQYIRTAAWIIKKGLHRNGAIRAEMLTTKEKAALEKDDALMELYKESCKLDSSFSEEKKNIRQKYCEALTGIVGKQFFRPIVQGRKVAPGRRPRTLKISPGVIVVYQVDTNRRTEYDFTDSPPTKNEYYHGGGSFGWCGIENAVMDGALSKGAAKRLSAAMEKAEAVYPHERLLGELHKEKLARDRELHQQIVAAKDEVRKLENELD